MPRSTARLPARQFVQLIQDWEAKDITVLSPSELLSGAGIVFQESVRLYTHLQAGTVPLSTMSEGLFTQFYHRLVRRKGDPAATIFLFGSETVALRAEKALFDLAAWCRERPALADLPAPNPCQPGSPGSLASPSRLPTFRRKIGPPGKRSSRLTWRNTVR